jgi:hypothetical protein
MANLLDRAGRVLTHLWRRKLLRRLIVWGALAYGVIYLWARGDLRFHGWISQAGITWAREPLSVLFKQRSAFYFEGVAIIDLPLLTWLFSPVNLAIGLALGVLVGLNLALSLAALRAQSGGGQSAATLLASGLALVTATACSAPVLLVVLGIQASAGLLALFSALVPAAFVLLLATFGWAIVRAGPEIVQDTE